ncbi:putative TRAP C4-dicarboxylate transport system permease DctM subunit [Desulforapulum autotrophicum HRM2]|uniref:TRAP C4-dicarboxylate transport system permease DctM subunit n=1 Tax=Desulforapulum autotrophicum (strain ATCC 43914 / DSM 3382 / VKM B-1955 / HRM2) TaxID=177437 RepID=C0QGE3_DESAH|nr:TRAP transporter large permease subunit [Desulforapulum autotrophicum]ACN17722.1 putative TRAP C4-dicarboxylate transport system permease DctM subunit [Desulforapulum autotrophicum HRM2]
MISDPLLMSLVLFGFMFLCLFSGLWIGFSLLGTGIFGMLVFNLNLPPVISVWDKIGGLLANSIYNSTNSWSLTALPLFILMGEILYRTEISTKLLNGLLPWLANIPGRLLHINVFACSLFAAVSGSSAATTATVGKITLDELSRRGYDKRLAIGSLAGAGTLGFLIPPSLIMIIFGILSDTSIGKLFMGGVIPGMMLAGAYSIYIILVALVNPDVVPHENETFTLAQKLTALKDLTPILGLIFAVLGGIYMGITTPTEAAAIGVIGSIVLAFAFKNLTWANFKDALINAVKTNCMICFIILSASFLSQVVGFVGIARALSVYITGLGLSPYMLILVVGLMYIVLGMMLDGISIVVMTLPIVLPIVVAAGFQPLWFGIFLVFMVELSQITPPVGFSIFVIQGISTETVGTILRATLPFFIIMVLMVVMITLFPDIVFYLPEKMVQ